MNNNQELVSSPCISKCSLNDKNICIGCFRSIDEITLWSKVDNQTLRFFLQNINNRKKHLKKP
ncbi:MAG: DUF1289 domain-containing protein [Methylococcales bacterium]|nr:DUF1289 domain-containing protein [Methylococcales bacterium]